METLAAHAGLVILYAFLIGCLLLTALGLAGNWIIVAVAVLMRLLGVESLSLPWLGGIVGLALLGEVIESLLGLIVVARKGGSRWGMAGSFIGVLLGALLAVGIFPPFGSLVCAFAGAFAGAAIGEYWRTPNGREALRVGIWSFVGKTLAAVGKLATGAGMIAVVILRTW